MSATVHDNPARFRFELDVDGGTGFINYTLAGDVITFDYTEVPPQVRERGIGSRLVQGALELARARGLKVRPRCPFVRAYVDKHPELRDLLA